MASESHAAIHVLILAEDPLARAGLAALLAPTPALAIAGQSAATLANAADFAQIMAAFLPDVVLWDLGWSPEGAVELVSRFCAIDATPVVALLAIDSLADALRGAGARGLLLRTSSAEQMTAALRAVVHGLRVFDESLLPAPGPGAFTAELVEPLSSRELEVLRHIAEGLSNKEIARALTLSENTIKFHINAMLGKLGAQSRTEAVVKATRAGLILL